MKIQILETKTGKLQPALIEKATFKDMPLKKDGWNFNWRQLFKTEGAEVYKVTLEQLLDVVEGLMVFSLVDEQMVVLDDVELAPENIGSRGKYKKIAGALVAFCCYQSRELGKGNYLGYVSFTSKTRLIEYYQKKYGATHVFGQKMYLSSEAGKKLIEEYLKLEDDEKA